MIEQYKTKVRINLKKVQGQIKLINKMIDNERYCLDIVQQTNASIGLLKQINSYILESHLLSCGVENFNSKNKKKRLEFVKELTKVFKLNNK